MKRREHSPDDTQKQFTRMSTPEAAAVGSSSVTGKRNTHNILFKMPTFIVFHLKICAWSKPDYSFLHRCKLRFIVAEEAINIRLTFGEETANKRILQRWEISQEKQEYFFLR